MRARWRPSGFTLIELCYVLAIMAALTAMTVPVYDVHLRRARSHEAEEMVQAIASAELRHWRDRGDWLACGPFGDVPRAPAAFPEDQACWKALGVRAGGPVRYRYGVAVEDGTFLVTAEGDQDGDGVRAVFRLHGRDLRLERVEPEE